MAAAVPLVPDPRRRPDDSRRHRRRPARAAGSSCPSARGGCRRARAAGRDPGHWSSSPTSTSTTSAGTTAFEGMPLVAHRESIALSAERGRPLPTERDRGRRRGRAGARRGRLRDSRAPTRSHERPRRRRARHPAATSPCTRHSSPGPASSTSSDDDADRSAQTREEALSAYGDRILACGHFPGSGFGRIVDGIWAALRSDPGGATRANAVGSAACPGLATTRSSNACAHSWPSEGWTRSSCARPTTSST